MPALSNFAHLKDPASAALFMTSSLRRLAHQLPSTSNSSSSPLFLPFSSSSPSHPSSGGGGSITAGLPPPKEKRFSCPQCGRSYAAMTSVNRHLRWECGLEPQFTCQVCQRRFYHKHTLTHHLRGAHEIFSLPPTPAAPSSAGAGGVGFGAAGAVVQPLALAVPKRSPSSLGT
jgi:hypothetical protein